MNAIIILLINLNQFVLDFKRMKKYLDVVLKDMLVIYYQIDYQVDQWVGALKVATTYQS